LGKKGFGHPAVRHSRQPGRASFNIHPCAQYTTAAAALCLVVIHITASEGIDARMAKSKGTVGFLGVIHLELLGGNPMGTGRPDPSGSQGLQASLPVLARGENCRPCFALETGQRLTPPGNQFWRCRLKIAGDRHVVPHMKILDLHHFRTSPRWSNFSIYLNLSPSQGAVLFRDIPGEFLPRVRLPKYGRAASSSLPPPFSGPPGRYMPIVPKSLPRTSVLP
jgi:hypothetical protein